MRHKNIVILGATRGVGRELLTQALEAGYQVTAFARTAASIPIQHKRLGAVAASVTDDEAILANAIRGQDAVISTLGRGMSLKSENLIQRSVPAILSAMHAQGVRRLIFTSAIGVGDSIKDAPLFSRIMARLLLSDLYADKAAGEALIRRSDLDWTLVQPAQLTDGPLTGEYQAGEHLKLRGMPKISRADTAHFLLRELESPAFVRKIVTIAY